MTRRPDDWPSMYIRATRNVICTLPHPYYFSSLTLTTALPHVFLPCKSAKHSGKLSSPLYCLSLKIVGVIVFFANMSSSAFHASGILSSSFLE